MIIATTITVFVTIYNPAIYSISSTTIYSGFVSAGVYIEILQKTKAAYKAATAKEVVLKKARYSKSGINITSLLITKTAKKRLARQGSITNFFARPSVTTVQGNRRLAQLMASSKPFIQRSWPAVFNNVFNTYLASCTLYIPSSTSTYKLHSELLLGRPQKVEDKEGVDIK